MADNIIQNPDTIGPVIDINEWTKEVELNEKISKGYAQITLSDYADGATSPDIQAGSKYEVNGSYFETTSAQTPTGWGGISNSTQAYIKAVPSGSGNSTTITWTYTDTTPTWSDTKQGYYDGNDRYFFAIYKDSSGEYDNREKYLTPENNILEGNATVDIIKLAKGNVVEGATSVVTLGDIYDGLEEVVPEINDLCLISCGHAYTTTIGSNKFVYNRIYQYAKRTSSTQISLQGTSSTINFDTGTGTIVQGLAGSANTIVATDGSTVVLDSAGSGQFRMVPGSRIV